MAVSPLWLQGWSSPSSSGSRSWLPRHPGLPGPRPGPRTGGLRTGKVLITGEEILQGQELFLTYGLMQYGSVYGHGAYLGPDFTADYLHRQAG